MGAPTTHINCSKPCAAPPSTIYASSHIHVVLRQIPAQITSPSPSPRRRADKTLTRHLLDQEFKGRHRAERVQNSELPYVRYLIGRNEKTFDYINHIKQTLPLSVYEGTWTHSPLLVAMHLLDRACMIVGKFLKLHATFPNGGSRARSMRR